MSDHSAVIELLSSWPQGAATRSLTDLCADRVRQAVEALDSTSEDVGSGDLAGLIGHWLRREAFAGRGDRVRVPHHPRWPTHTDWERAGLTVLTRERERFLLAPGLPWT